MTNVSVKVLNCKTGICWFHWFPSTDCRVLISTCTTLDMEMWMCLFILVNLNVLVMLVYELSMFGYIIFSTIDQCIFFIGPNCASVRSYISQWVSCLPRQLTFLFLHFTLVCVVTSTKMTENDYQNSYIRILQQENKCIGYFP